MNRREFIALVGAGAAFPAAFVEAQTQPVGSLAGLADDDHIQYYPIYYTAGRSDSLPWYTQYVFQLWQPGIVMGMDEEKWYRRIRLLTPQGDPWKEHDNLREAIGECPAHGLVVDDGFSSPYYGSKVVARYRPRTHHAEHRPLLLRYDNAEQFVAEGHLSRYQPFCTFEEFLRRNS